MDDIPTLGEIDYRNLFITCSTLDLDKEKREVSKPSTYTQTVATDGFDWEEDLFVDYIIRYSVDYFINNIYKQTK